MTKTLNTGRPRNTVPAQPSEIQEFIWNFINASEGEILRSEVRDLILDEFNIKLTISQVHNLINTLITEDSFVHRTLKDTKKTKWTDDETKYCAKLYKELPPRGSSEAWSTLLNSLNGVFHKGVPIRSKKAVEQKMWRANVKRKGTIGGTPVIQTFDFYEKVLLEAGLKLLKWESGTAFWKIECKECGEIYTKTQIYNTNGAGAKKLLPLGCKYCVDDPNGYTELYLTKVFCEKSGAHSKLGISKDPSSRISSFGTTLTDTTWPDLTNSVGRKIEEQVAEKFGEYKTYPEELIGNGHTECYNTLVHEQIKEYVYQLLLDAKSSKPQNIS